MTGLGRRQEEGVWKINPKKNQSINEVQRWAVLRRTCNKQIKKQIKKQRRSCWIHRDFVNVLKREEVQK